MSKIKKPKVEQTLYNRFNGNVYKALKYIVTNNLKIEHSDHGTWKPCTLRDLLKYLVGNENDKDFYPWYLSYYRIKKVTKEEIRKLKLADKNED